MIKIVAVFDIVGGKVKGGVDLSRSPDVSPQLAHLGDLLHAAMSHALQSWSRQVQGQPMESDKELKEAAQFVRQWLQDNPVKF